jgi:ribosome-binding factor A
MKFTPELEFEEDPGSTGGERVEWLLEQIRLQEQARADGEAS